MRDTRSPRPTTHNDLLNREDAKISRCPRCGAWRYQTVCTGACPVLALVPR